ncbi:MAG: acyl-CoA dehydrogenase family protein [Conexivisphaera sp.]|jgi:alkylation response protein AidB-like acyl-CoA dehydrogenase
MVSIDEAVSYVAKSLPDLAGDIDSRNRVGDDLLEGLSDAGAFRALTLGIRNIYGLIRLTSRWSPAVAHVIATSATVAFRIGRDDGIYSLCVTEPRGGSDVKGNLLTSAEDAGDEAIIRGEKAFASNGIYATHYLVLANGSQGPTLYLVERGSGVSVEVLDLFTFRGSGVSMVRFEGARGRRVGTPGRGIREALEAINYERLSYGSIGLGIMEGALEDAGPRALSKRIFGRELGEYQGVRWMLAELEVRARLLESLMDAALSRAEVAGRVDPLDAVVAKVAGAELAQRSTWVAVQVMGGSGFTRRTRLERLARDARMLDIGAGAREVLYDYLGDHAARRWRAGEGTDKL